MQKTPRDKGKAPDPKKDDDDHSSWEEDQKERGYYFDDAHGYEVYKPDEDDEGED